MASSSVPEPALAGDGLPRARSFLFARWFFLRALGVFYLSVFWSLAWQILGLLGDDGILPVRDLFAFVGRREGAWRFWTLPSLLWLAPNDRGLEALVGLGLVASLLLIANVAPRASLVACGVLFVSFVSAARDFSSYQSEGMLLEATAAGALLAPRGLRPGFAAAEPPRWWARGLVLWECFRIYFESGVAKLASGDPSWRDMTAMDHYYENGPLPTWMGWWAQQLPHGFHAATAVVTLVAELGLVFGLFAPRRVQLVTAALLTLLQVGIIATANYCFLNYLVLALGLTCIDDEALRLHFQAADAPRRHRTSAALAGWFFYGTVAAFVLPGAPEPISWLAWPAEPLEHLRLANRYGLFARMTTVRYEIELEGTADGVRWVPYPFRYKPQALDEAPKVFAPYQPRLDWNLWFCAVAQEGGKPRNIPRTARATCPWVLALEARLLERSPAVLRLFRDDPLRGSAPRAVRATLWQYWMTTPEELRRTGRFWRRERVGTYIDTVTSEGQE